MKDALKAVLLDFDGTIAYFTFDAQKARAEILRILSESGLPQDLFKPEYRVSEILNKVEEYLNTNLSREDLEKVKKVKKRMWQVVEEHEMDAAKVTRLIEGVDEVLKSLRQMGLKLVVITNNSRRPTNHILRKIGLENFFDIILTRDATQFMKPHPQPIQTALTKLGIRASEAVFVGDSPIDVRACKEAGVIAIGVTTGTANEDMLKSSGARYVISSLSQLHAIIKD